MDYYSYYLKHYYDWLYCIHVPSDNEFVACVDRENVTVHHYVRYNNMYNLVVVVVLG